MLTLKLSNSFDATFQRRLAAPPLLAKKRVERWIRIQRDGRSIQSTGHQIFFWAFRSGEFRQATSKGGRSVLGAIALPELGLVLSAAEGQGLRLNQQPVPNSARATPVKLIALGEYDYESGLQTDLRAQTLRDEGYAVVRYRCAVFSLASAALGRLNGYVENGCGLWDIAAAKVICREAGMTVHISNIAAGRDKIDARWGD